MNNILYMKVWLLKASCRCGWRLALTYQYLNSTSYLYLT